MKKNIFNAVLSLSVLTIVSGCSKKQEQGGQHADEKHQQPISCENNLRMIGTTFRVWAGDHDQKFPYQISTNAGGTLELVSPDREGFDSNAFLYLKTMTGEEGMSTPRLLVCPQDKSKMAAVDWTNLLPENVTYRFCADTNVGPFSKKILAVCPVDGNILYCDGTVTSKDGKRLETLQPANQDSK